MPCAKWSAAILVKIDYKEKKIPYVYDLRRPKFYRYESRQPYIHTIITLTIFVHEIYTIIRTGTESPSTEIILLELLQRKLCLLLVGHALHYIH